VRDDGSCQQSAFSRKTKNQALRTKYSSLLPIRNPKSAISLYPDGWENLGVQRKQGIAILGLRHPDDMIEATLYWSPAGDTIDVMTVGDVEQANLAPIYSDKVGVPQPILIRGKAGFKIPIQGGPLGVDDPNLVGGVYVFAIPFGGDWYKIKLRATASSEEGLAKAEKLLDNYRW
jgi:hypothetical protein